MSRPPCCSPPRLCPFGGASPAPRLPTAVPQPRPAAHRHKHYEVSDQAAQPGPDGELAPRLQSLGSHTFPVSTKNADAQRS